MTLLPELSFVGEGLQRPECVLAHASGVIVASDVGGMGGVAVIAPSGAMRRIEARDPPEPLRPNGIALLPGGSILLAHLGDEHGGVFRLYPDGGVEAFLIEIDGVPLPPTNFVMRDLQGRIWITVSTRKRPRQSDYRPDACDGFIVLVDSRGARVVADGLGYTNECALHPAGDRLFVNETFGRRTSVFTVRADGSLADRRTFATYVAGTFPDGLAFDAEGGIWITSIVSNRIVRVGADGDQKLVAEDCDDGRLQDVEAAFQNGAMDGNHLAQRELRTLRNVSSLAFGGADQRTAYLGSLSSGRVATFRSTVPGHPPAHWRDDIGALSAWNSEDRRIES